MVDERLARSFRSIGEDYDRHRPGFPVAAADEIVPLGAPTILDLGAGTGKFTALLTPRATRVIAVEPSEAMLGVLRRRLPDVDALGGSAERIPVADGSVDVVTVAQAFHWFDREAACAEIRRVLVPQGVLGLVWNRSDPACAWDLACTRVAHPALGNGLSGDDATRELLPGFASPRVERVPWRERISRQAYLARWLTVSSFLAAADDERARMLSAVERILDRDPETAGREEFELPQVTDVYVYRAI
ncbi:class I SAM-dependent methyltransferase [Microbacterium sp. NPDC089698]|uniref:class I SAM-dependent methyltransferase n=1 Tax=Microbacterium sp. NPDC089698 TaxID=3364200 RepID=UPI00381D9C57